MENMRRERLIAKEAVRNPGESVRPTPLFVTASFALSRARENNRKKENSGHGRNVGSVLSEDKQKK